MLLFLFLFTCLLFMLNSNNLLFSLLLLEILAFISLSGVCSLSYYSYSDFVVISLFSAFVIEGVIALSGLISLVSTTGSDYVSSSSFLNC